LPTQVVSCWEPQIDFCWTILGTGAMCTAALELLVLPLSKERESSSTAPASLTRGTVIEKVVVLLPKHVRLTSAKFCPRSRRRALAQPISLHACTWIVEGKSNEEIDFKMRRVKSTSVLCLACESSEYVDCNPPHRRAYMIASLSMVSLQGEIDAPTLLNRTRA